MHSNFFILWIVLGLLKPTHFWEMNAEECKKLKRSSFLWTLCPVAFQQAPTQAPPVIENTFSDFEPTTTEPTTTEDLLTIIPSTAAPRVIPTTNPVPSVAITATQESTTAESDFPSSTVAPIPAEGKLPALQTDGDQEDMIASTTGRPKIVTENITRPSAAPTPLPAPKTSPEPAHATEGGPEIAMAGFSVPTTGQATEEGDSLVVEIAKMFMWGAIFFVSSAISAIALIFFVRRDVESVGSRGFCFWKPTSLDRLEKNHRRVLKRMARVEREEMMRKRRAEATEAEGRYMSYGDYDSDSDEEKYWDINGPLPLDNLPLPRRLDRIPEESPAMMQDSGDGALSEIKIDSGSPTPAAPGQQDTEIYAVNQAAKIDQARQDRKMGLATGARPKRRPHTSGGYDLYSARLRQQAILRAEKSKARKEMIRAEVEKELSEEKAKKAKLAADAQAEVERKKALTLQAKAEAQAKRDHARAEKEKIRQNKLLEKEKIKQEQVLEKANALAKREKEKEDKLKEIEKNKALKEKIKEDQEKDRLAKEKAKKDKKAEASKKVETFEMKEKEGEASQGADKTSAGAASSEAKSSEAKASDAAPPPENSASEPSKWTSKLLGPFTKK